MPPGVQRVRERDAQSHYCRFPVYRLWKAEWTFSRKLQEKCSCANRLRVLQFCEHPRGWEPAGPRSSGPTTLLEHSERSP